MPPFFRPPRRVQDEFPVARLIGGILERLPQPAVLALGYGLLLGVAWIDYNVTPLRLTFLIYYLIPIFVVAWFGGPMQGILIGVAAGLLNLVIDLHYSNLYANEAWPVLNDLVASAVYVIAARITSLMRALIVAEQVLARTDSMTGAANRRAFFEIVEHELNRSRRTNDPLTLVYIDLDDFKLVNDRWGHNTGDSALRAVVVALNKYTRATDVVARLGGDEFAVFLPAANGNAQAAVERLQSEVINTMRENGWPITCSIGAVTFTQPPNSADDMLREADRLMYIAKHLGKNHLEYRTLAAVQP